MPLLAKAKCLNIWFAGSNRYEGFRETESRELGG